MQVADIDLCKELYMLSKWDKTAFYWDSSIADETDIHFGDGFLPVDGGMYPAYDLGYLIRKLPGVTLEQIDKDYWKAQKSYNDGTELPDYKSCDADTPENTTCKLAIELWKAGILKR